MVGLQAYSVRLGSELGGDRWLSVSISHSDCRSGMGAYCVRLEADDKEHQLGQQCQRTEDYGEGESYSKPAVLS